MTRLTVALGLLLLVAPAAAGAATPPSHLTIAVYPNGLDTTPVHRFRLDCAPAGGTVPRPVRACTLLNRLADAFAPVPPRTMCAQVIEGPQEAVVTGVLRGRRIAVRLSLASSCETARWRRVAVVVPGSGSG
jgi:hypothetical protein